MSVLLVRANLGGNDNDDDDDDETDENYDDGDDDNLLSKIQCREGEEEKKLPEKPSHHGFNLCL